MLITLMRLMVLGGLAVFLAHCSSPKLASQWRDREIAIDGVDTDWHDAKMHIEKTAVDIGVINDAEYLYICLTSADRIIQMQIARMGFTVWFDPGGGKSKKLGVRFPRGMRGPDMGSLRGLGRGGRPNPGQLQALFDQLLLQGEMEILGPEKDQSRRLAVGGGAGLDVRVVYDRGRLVYELRIPLVLGGFVLDKDGGSFVGIGFETAEPDRDAMRQRMGGGGLGGRPGGGVGGGLGGVGGDGRRPGGFGGGRGMGMGGGRTEPMQIWAKIELAAGPAR